MAVTVESGPEFPATANRLLPGIFLQHFFPMAIARNEHQLYDYLLVHNDRQYIGVIPVALLLDTLNRTMEEQKLNQ